MNRKPIIGIVEKHIETSDPRPDGLIRDEYKQAVFDNGGIAIGILSPDEPRFIHDDWAEYLDSISQAEIIAQVNLCDGIILPGGAQSEPYEPFIARYCYEHDIPCLGICAGQNNIARALGGTTCPVPNPEKHLRPEDAYVHTTTIIDPDSKFAKIVGENTTFKVNSRHKNILDACPGLKVVAVCDDGYKEVVEASDKKFYLGIRNHPESLYKIDEVAKRIFEAFITAAGENS